MDLSHECLWWMQAHFLSNSCCGVVVLSLPLPLRSSEEPSCSMRLGRRPIGHIFVSVCVSNFDHNSILNEACALVLSACAINDSSYHISVSRETIEHGRRRLHLARPPPPCPLVIYAYEQIKEVQHFCDPSILPFLLSVFLSLLQCTVLPHSLPLFLPRFLPPCPHTHEHISPNTSPSFLPSLSHPPPASSLPHFSTSSAGAPPPQTPSWPRVRWPCRPCTGRRYHGPAPR